MDLSEEWERMELKIGVVRIGLEGEENVDMEEVDIIIEVKDGFLRIIEDRIVELIIENGDELENIVKSMIEVIDEIDNVLKLMEIKNKIMRLMRIIK